MKKTPLILYLILLLNICLTAQVKYNSPATGNPIIPGYFADPTVRKFGDMYYIYSTTDGNGGGKGPSQVWVSKDFVHWTLMPMNWPTTEFYWAPEVIEKDGQYYLYYCEPCVVYCGVSETPRGPWRNILENDKDVLIPDRFVEGAITLDPQTFTDDDGSVYLYWGTWGIYDGFGCGAGKLNDDMKTFSETLLIPNTDIVDFFEAPFVIKKDGIYYFTYSSGSCHDHTYRVQYATSTVGPLGPYTFADNNPILSTNADGTIHGPGHHSILEENGEYYIVYHRHNNPHSTRGMHRQIAVDKLIVGNGRIEKVNAGNEGIGFLQSNTNPFEDLAFQKAVTVSSYYNDNFKPEYAVDNNNGTLWRPATCNEEYIEIDLGDVKNIRRIWTQFEYPTSFYQYITQVSEDGLKWKTFADKTTNLLNGSPMVDYGDEKGRYVRLVFTGGENNGMSGALWNIKVFGDSESDPPQRLVYLPSAVFNKNKRFDNSLGMLSGCFNTTAETQLKDDLNAVVLNADSKIESSFDVPKTIFTDGFTLSFKVYEENAKIRVNLGNQYFEIPVKKAEGWQTVSAVYDGRNVNYYIGQERLGKTTLKKSNSQSKLLSITTDRTVSLTELRLYNWQQTLFEIEFDASEITKVLPQSAPRREGMIFKIDASDYKAGESIKEIKTNKGKFFSDRSIDVVLKNKRNAFEFDGNTSFQSDFGLPESIMGNAIFTVSAWILNPELSENEWILDINESNGELHKVMFGYGADTRAGIVSHNGQYEDMGVNNLLGDNEWKHIAITFDGYKEKIYINGELQKEKDIVLRLPKSNKLFLGTNSRGENLFSGWLSELNFYGTALSAPEIKELSQQKKETSVLIEFNASSIDYYANTWKNEAILDSYAELENGRIVDKDGKIALKDALYFYNLLNRIPVKGISIDFFVDSKDFHLLSCLDFNMEFNPKKSMIKINDEEIPVSGINKKGWNRINVSPQDGIIYLNGNEYNIQNNYKILLNNFMIGGKNTYISSVQVDSETLNPDRIKKHYTEFMNSGIENTLSVDINPVSVERIRATISANQANYKYNYINKTTGNSSGWISSNYYLFENVIPAKTNELIVKAKDAYGNVRTLSKNRLKVSEKDFYYINESFETDIDFLTTDNSVWDGIIYNVESNPKMKIENGKLTLGSEKSSVHAAKENYPVFPYIEVEGDFLSEIELSDFSGYKERNAVGLTEGGILVMYDEDDNSIGAIQIGSFPYWNVGNIITETRGRWRPQYFNKKGWELDRFMQIERSGDHIFIRTSADGENWTNMPSSPLHRPDLKNKKLKVGPFQSTNDREYGEATFKYFKLWQLN